ncbi:hypothetical protein M3665_28140, partial [Bacillus licheniformis]|nr:hypothetical protein [Bacillus licheniformis]
MTSRSARPTGTHAFEASFGATCIDAEHTRFRLWAPASRTAAVELQDEGGRALPMTPADVWVWLRSDDRGEIVLRARAIERALAPAFVLQEAVDGFR